MDPPERASRWSGASKVGNSESLVKRGPMARHQVLEGAAHGKEVRRRESTVVAGGAPKAELAGSIPGRGGLGVGRRSGAEMSATVGRIRGGMGHASSPAVLMKVVG